MSPLLHPGDMILSTKTFPEPNNVVVMHHPGKYQQVLVKRILAVEGQTVDGLLIHRGHCWVQGDADGIDSRSFGPGIKD